VVEGYSLEELETVARAVGFGGIGVYKAANFMHLDLGPARRWEL